VTALAPVVSPADPFDAGPYPWIEGALHRLRADAPRITRRAFITAMIAWLPLVVLAGVQGLARRPNAREAFLLDLSAHARYLLALPILIVAKPSVLVVLGATLGPGFAVKGGRHAERGRCAPVFPRAAARAHRDTSRASRSRQERL